MVCAKCCSTTWLQSAPASALPPSGAGIEVLVHLLIWFCDHTLGYHLGSHHGCHRGAILDAILEAIVYATLEAILEAALIAWHTVHHLSNTQRPYQARCVRERAVSFSTLPSHAK